MQRLLQVGQPNEEAENDLADLIEDLTNKVRDTIVNWVSNKHGTVDPDLLDLAILQTASFYVGFATASCGMAKIDPRLITASVSKFIKFGKEEYERSRGMTPENTYLQ
jgi:hypothetical protein